MLQEMGDTDNSHSKERRGHPSMIAREGSSLNYSEGSVVSTGAGRGRQVAKSERQLGHWPQMGKCIGHLCMR